MQLTNYGQQFSLLAVRHFDGKLLSSGRDLQVTRATGWEQQKVQQSVVEPISKGRDLKTSVQF